MNKQLVKVLKLSFNTLHFITTDEPINIVIYSQKCRRNIDERKLIKKLVGEIL